MILEIDGDQMHFQVISDQAKTVDSGVITRRKVDTEAAPSQPAAPPVKPVPPKDKPSTSTANPSTVTPAARNPAPAKSSGR